MACSYCKGKNKIEYNIDGYSFRVYGHSRFFQSLNYCPLCFTSLGYKKETNSITKGGNYYEN